MTFMEWLSQNNDYLIQTTKNITKNHEETMDLYQSVMTQLIPKADTLNDISDKEKLYYFIKVIKTNWFSNTSPYQYNKLKYEKKRNTYEEYKDYREDIEYNETIPDMDWVEAELHKIGWFEHDLFMLFYETKTLTALHKETQIPINSVGKYIKEIKQELKKRWNEKEKRM